jgi:hypothetical protein
LDKENKPEVIQVSNTRKKVNITVEESTQTIKNKVLYKEV